MKKIVFAVSPSGGHILPALYIAEVLEKEFSDIKISFIINSKEINNKLIPEKYETHTIKSLGVSKKGISNFFKVVLNSPKLFIESFKLIKKLSPDVVVGTGGYNTIFPILASKLFLTPNLIHEAERKSGIANKVLSFFVTKVTKAHKDTFFLTLARIHYTGQPINPKFLEIDYSKRSYGKIKKILVSGGSLGSSEVDNYIKSCVKEIKDLDIEVLHQSREENVESLNKFFNENGVVKYTAIPFIDDMPEKLFEYDLIVSRAGLNTVNEIILSGIPAVLLPLPNAEEQTFNAKRVEDLGRGEIYTNQSLTSIIEKYSDLENKFDTLDQNPSLKIAKIINELSLK